MFFFTGFFVRLHMHTCMHASLTSTNLVEALAAERLQRHLSPVVPCLFETCLQSCKGNVRNLECHSLETIPIEDSAGSCFWKKVEQRGLSTATGALGVIHPMSPSLRQQSIPVQSI